MPASEYPPYPGAGPTSSSYPFPDNDAPRNKHVHFPDSFSPSSFSIRIKLGPRDYPSSIVKISIEFEPGRFPRIKVRSKKLGEPSLSSRRRRRRRY